LFFNHRLKIALGDAGGMETFRFDHSRADGVDANFLKLQAPRTVRISAVPLGLVRFDILPGVETPDYFRLSRWDNESLAFVYAHRILQAQLSRICSVIPS
jgi:hypothetical protein